MVGTMGPQAHPVAISLVLKFLCKWIYLVTGQVLTLVPVLCHKSHMEERAMKKPLELFPFPHYEGKSKAVPHPWEKKSVLLSKTLKDTEALIPIISPFNLPGYLDQSQKDPGT